jgi:hypothetical protein
MPGRLRVRRIRVVSRQPAPSTITLALKSSTSRVFASMTRTPAARPVASSRNTSDTTEYGRMVRLPLSRAGYTSAVGEWKAALTSQPRPQRPRPRQRERYLLLRSPSVVTPGAAGDVVPAQGRDRALEGDLDAVELARALEDAVRDLVEPFLGAGAPEEHVHLVVVGADFGIPDRPVHVVAVEPGRVELHGPVAQGAAAPEVRLAPSTRARTQE